MRAFQQRPKVRLQLGDQLRFYYPDAQVTFHPNPPDDTFQDRPILIVEVISEATRRADEGEKRDGYLTLSSLEQYLLVEPGRPCVTVWRRTADGFVREVFSGLASVISLATLNMELPLREIYGRVTFQSLAA